MCISNEKNNINAGVLLLSEDHIDKKNSGIFYMEYSPSNNEEINIYSVIGVNSSVQCANAIIEASKKSEPIAKLLQLIFLLWK